MSSPWVPRRYKPGDDSKIDALLKTCFPEYRGLEYWSWILKSNPLGFHGPEGDIWVAEAPTGNLVGHICRIRVPMWFHGKSVVGSQIGLLATHPDYRRQGVTERLAVLARKDGDTNRIAVTFGFPNRYSYPLSIKRGLLDFGEVHDLEYVLNRVSFVKLRHRNPLKKSVASLLLSLASVGLVRPTHADKPFEVEMTPGFLDDVGTVWESLKHAYDLSIERTRAYLAWRYNRIWGDYAILSAVRRGETLGYIVFRIARQTEAKIAFICELVSIDDDLHVYRRLLEEVLRRSRDEGITYLAASSSCSRASHSALRKSGFRNFDSVMNVFRGYNAHLVARFEKGHDVQAARLKWYHSIGDRDFG